MKFLLLSLKTRCVCDVTYYALSDEQNLKLMQFIMGLNECYSAIISNNIMIIPLHIVK